MKGYRVMEAGVGAGGAREDVGSWESTAEVTLGEKGRCPSLRGMPGKEGGVADERKAVVGTRL